MANMELRTIVKEATALVHGQAKALAPVNKGPLGESIHMQVKNEGDAVVGRVYTNAEYAAYVEFGTGVKGDGTYPYKIEGEHLTYEDAPWYIPVDKLPTDIAEKYHFKKVYGKEGAEYYECYGQEAQPFMYPALKFSEKAIMIKFSNGVKAQLKKNCKGSQ